MEIRKTKSNDHAILSLGGRFDFNAHREFKEAYSSLITDTTVHSLEVNLSGVDYLDSSALGMLLMMRERVESSGKQISLSNPNETVAKILDIANFKKIFKIT